MVYPPMNVVLLSFVALRGLVVVPRLLLRSLPLSTIVELTWCVLDIPLGAVVSIVPCFTTLETSVFPSRSRVGIPDGCAGGSILAILREAGPWRRLASVRGLLVLLTRALVLVLPIVSHLSPITELCHLRRCKTGTVIA